MTKPKLSKPSRRYLAIWPETEQRMTAYQRYSVMAGYPFSRLAKMILDIVCCKTSPDDFEQILGIVRACSALDSKGLQQANRQISLLQKEDLKENRDKSCISTQIVLP